VCNGCGVEHLWYFQCKGCSLGGLCDRCQPLWQGQVGGPRQRYKQLQRSHRQLEEHHEQLQTSHKRLEERQHLLERQQTILRETHELELHNIQQARELQLKDLRRQLHAASRVPRSERSPDRPPSPPGRLPGWTPRPPEQSIFRPEASKRKRRADEEEDDLPSAKRERVESWVMAQSPISAQETAAPKLQGGSQQGRAPSAESRPRSVHAAISQHERQREENQDGSDDDVIYVGQRQVTPVARTPTPPRTPTPVPTTPRTATPAGMSMSLCS
jgi:hypothetical protein